ncbi:MAG: 30S ribosomal protein S1 [Acidobacteriota bacterium]|nr:30S ribosomal protein S1 [Acidobacteriota bacterium]
MSLEEIRSSQEVGTDLEQPVEVSTVTPGATESSEMSNLLEGMETLAAPALVPGDVVQGKVLKVSDGEVIIDLGLKTEVSAPFSEFLNADGQVSVAPGDTVDIWIEQYNEETGRVEISHQKAARRKVWEDIEKAFREQTSITGKVLDRIKGGLTVDVGVPAFLPASHADARTHSNIDSLKGQEITCKIIKINRKRNNVVVSRKLVLEEELNRRKGELAERLVEGAELVGKVKNLADYGVFVDLGGMDGLLHITDLSWGRVSNPAEVVQVGQEIRVKVLKHDLEKGRVSLGLKQLTPDPWEMVPNTYHVDDRVTGRVVSLTDYGAFVELEPGVEGLIHISEMSWSKRLRHPSKILKIGDSVDVGVLEVNMPKRRISLSLKASLPDPWSTVAEKYAVGAVVQGRVRNLTDFGAFVEIEDGVDGLIHLANLSWNRNIKHPSEVLKKGQTVEAQVLALDPTNRRLALGLKQLEEDPWQTFFSKIHVGDMVHGKVTRQVSFGAFVELQDGIEGLCHVSEMEHEHGGSGNAKVEVGSEHEFRVIRLSAGDRKIALSMKAPEPPPPPPEPEIAKPKEPQGLSTMAQALSSAGITPYEST